jgi:hypothetical protein
MENRRLILKVVVNDAEARLVASAAACGGESVSGFLRRIALARSRQLVKDVEGQPADSGRVTQTA